MIKTPSNEKREEIMRKLREEDEKIDIRNIRKKTGLTQREFALKYHISTRTYETWESSEKSASHNGCLSYVKYLLNRVVDFELMTYGMDALDEQTNSMFSGLWLMEARNLFSKKDCYASRIGEGYVKGSAIRNDYLEKVLEWIADRDGLDSGEKYIYLHKSDNNANDIKEYYEAICEWAKQLFPVVRIGVTDVAEWGILYNRYHLKEYDGEIIKRFNDEVLELSSDKTVTRKKGIIEYILSERTEEDKARLLR